MWEWRELTELGCWLYREGKGEEVVRWLSIVKSDHHGRMMVIKNERNHKLSQFDSVEVVKQLMISMLDLLSLKNLKNIWVKISCIEMGQEENMNGAGHGWHNQKSCRHSYHMSINQSYPLVPKELKN